MAKEGIGSFSSMEEVYCRHDPVSGREKCFYRRRHNRIRSLRLERFESCMRSHLEGQEYRGHGAREDSILVRQAFTRASHECSRLVHEEGLPSDGRR